MNHPSNRAERRRSAEAKALQVLRPKKINGKKRKIYTEIAEKESEDALRGYRDFSRHVETSP